MSDWERMFWWTRVMACASESASLPWWAFARRWQYARMRREALRELAALKEKRR